MTSNQESSRRILIAVTGLSPQVITETIYALAVKNAYPWIPHEVHLITTIRGAENARLKLLSSEPGWFHRLRADYNLPKIDFDESHIHIIRRTDGSLLDDIRNEADNNSAADFIADKVRRLTLAADTEIHASIAGGRKTMGFYLGYAMSLYGRPQDRLSHVLVSPPFESHPEFYYPTPKMRVITSLDRGQDALDCSQAEVILAEIPFVSLRSGLPEKLLQGQSSFSKTVAAARRLLAPPELIIDLHARTIRAAGQTIPLSPAALALYSVFARRALANEPPLTAPPKGVPDPEWAQRFLDEYRLIRGDMADLENTERALRYGMDGEYFSQLKSKLHKAIEDALELAASPYLIGDGNTRPRRYALQLPKEAIRYESRGNNIVQRD